MTKPVPNNSWPEACHGGGEQLVSCSAMLEIPRMTRARNRLVVGIDNLLWHLRSKGVRETVHYSVGRLRRLSGVAPRRPVPPAAKEPRGAEGVLNLRPGELVEVRSEEEILATLDERGTLRGLALMSGMNRHCGKRYRVWKRLETMMLESTREFRKVKHTVLLDGVMCDGRFFNGCDRSCFYYWREAWLKRVEGPPRPPRAAGAPDDSAGGINC